MTVPSDGRAPDPAVFAPLTAPLLEGVRLFRAARPVGPVPVAAQAAWLVVVRINHLGRVVGNAPPDLLRLRQCLAPDFYLVLAHGRSVTLAAHADQDILVIAVTAEALGLLTGRKSAVLGHGDERIEADRFVAELVERVFDG